MSCRIVEHAERAAVDLDASLGVGAGMQGEVGLSLAAELEGDLPDCQVDRAEQFQAGAEQIVRIAVSELVADEPAKAPRVGSADHSDEVFQRLKNHVGDRRAPRIGVALGVESRTHQRSESALASQPATLGSRADAQPAMSPPCPRLRRSHRAPFVGGGLAGSSACSHLRPLTDCLQDREWPRLWRVERVVAVAMHCHAKRGRGRRVFSTAGPWPAGDSRPLVVGAPGSSRLLAIRPVPPDVTSLPR